MFIWLSKGLKIALRKDLGKLRVPQKFKGFSMLSPIAILKYEHPETSILS